MVIVGRGWSAEAGRAVRDNRVLCARLLLLFGFIAIAWLAGGIGVAHGDAAPEPGESTGDVTDLGAAVEEGKAPQGEEGHGSRLPDAADNATEDGAIEEGVTEMTESSAEEVTEPPIEILGDTGASTVLERTTSGDSAGQIMDETFRAVDETIHMAGGLAEGMVHTGQETVEGTDDQLRETDLVDTITDGLYEPAGEIDPRRGEAVPTPATADPRAGDRRTSSDAPKASHEDDEVERTSPAEESAVLPETPHQESVPQWHTAQESTEQDEHAEDADLGERVHLIGGGANHQTGVDATGASAPSFSGVGVAGFLVARVDLLAPPVRRAVLPGEPAPIVRDAADDPSYSPD